MVAYEWVVVELGPDWAVLKCGPFRYTVPSGALPPEASEGENLFTTGLRVEGFPVWSHRSGPVLRPEASHRPAPASATPGSSP